MARIVRVNHREAKLKRLIRQQLRAHGFHKDQDGRLKPPDEEKETYRQIHNFQRTQKLTKNSEFLATRSQSLLHHFANGSEVVPEKIEPELVPVLAGEESADLFKFASLLWRIPVSEGYGRRMRFLVKDKQNGKLIGLIALGDPVFNLRVRDQFIGWDHVKRGRGLVNVLDAFVLGSVPPYSTLLGGKLVAALVRSREIARAFSKKYGGSVGLISKKKKKPRLLLVTTTSALGRSSVYNRLKLGGTLYFAPIGYTQGWGHFHVSDGLFEEMRLFLKAKRDRYYGNNRFGQGPNWRLRAIRRTLDLLGLSAEIVHHGLKREVFVAELASNARQVLTGKHLRPNYRSLLSVQEIAMLARQRWLVPRAARRPEFASWRREELLLSLSWHEDVVGRERATAGPHV